MSPINLFALGVIFLSSVLSVWHVRSWESIKATHPAAPDLKFAWQQARRRILGSAILALVGVAAFVSQFLGPVLEIFVWAVIVLLVLSMMLLAVVDIVVSGRHFSRLQSGYLVEQAKLRAEIEQIRNEQVKHRSETNGHDGS